MLRDVVVDTNVIAHAQNPVEQRFEDAQRFLDDLLNAATVLCIDPGFHPDESRNSSLIGNEYLERLRAGSMAFEVVTRLFLARRTKEVSRNTSPALRRKILQLIKDARDRTFVAVATNSDEHVLVSHNFHGGLQERRRKRIRKELGVTVLDAGQCCKEL